MLNRNHVYSLSESKDYKVFDKDAPQPKEVIDKLQEQLTNKVGDDLWVTRWLSRPVSSYM